MKKIFLFSFFTVLLSSTYFSQINLKVNGKSFKGTKLMLDTVKCLSFTLNGVKIPQSGKAIKVSVYYELPGFTEALFETVVEGTAASKDLVETSETEFIIYGRSLGDNTKKLICESCGNGRLPNTMNDFMKDRKSNAAYKSFEIKIGVRYAEKINYTKYSNYIQIIKKQSLILENSGNTELPFTGLGFKGNEASNFSGLYQDKLDSYKPVGSLNCKVSFELKSTDSDSKTGVTYMFLKSDDGSSTLMENLKASFESKVKRGANTEEKVRKKIKEFEGHDYWTKELGIGTINAPIYNNYIDKAYNVDVDKSFLEKKVWEEFSAGKFIGFRYKAVCSFYNGLSKDIGCTIYLFTNPVNDAEVMIVIIRGRSGDTMAEVDKRSKVVETFFSVLH